MQLINRSTEYMIWMTYNATDGIANSAFGIHRAQGVLASGTSTKADGSGSVQIKVFTSRQPLVKMPFYLPAPRINASRDNTFDDSDDVVFTGYRLVKLDNNYKKLVGLPNFVPTPGKSSLSVDFTKVVKAVLTLAEALVMSQWQSAPTKWAPTGVFKVAQGLLDIFAPTLGSTRALTINDVKTTVESVIDQNEARLKTPHVFDVATWLDKYIEKSNSLAIGSANPTLVELSDYDRGQFLDELNKHVDGNTPFKGSMAELRDNRAIRKHAIPTYLLGIMLHLHLEILNLVVKRQTTPLDVADINALLNMARTYERTLPELEQDYVGFCQTLANQYPLLPLIDGIGRTDLQIVYAEPKPLEAIALAEGATTKWLQGDRMLIVKASEKVAAFISKTEHMSVARSNAAA